MNLRRLLTFLALPLVLGLDRLAYYGARSVLLVYMTRPAAEGGLGLPSPAATRDYAVLTMLVLLTPLLGGLLAIGIGPRLTLVIGAVLSALGYVLIGVAPAQSITVPFVILAVGQGLVRPSLFAIVGGELGRRHESWRNALCAVLYVAINLGAALAPIASTLMSRSGFTPVFFTSAGLMVLAVVVSVGLAVVQRFGPPPDEPPPWRGAEIGIMFILFLAMPYLSGLGVVSTAQYNVLDRSAGGALDVALMTLNPTIVTLASLVFALVLVVFALSKVRAPTLLMLGAGHIVFAIGVAPLLVAGDTRIAVVASIAVTALGEALVGPLLISRASADTNPRFAALVVAGWLVFSGLFTRAPDLLSERNSVFVVVFLSVTLLGCLVIGALLVALHKRIERQIFPEETTTR